MTHAARAAAERAARASYGRLVAVLARQSGDIAAAEDALSAALSKALEVWPRDGVPERPEAWLTTAAKRLVQNTWRHAGVRGAAEPDLVRMAQGSGETDTTHDPRLDLMFVCAHPAIVQEVRTPLMLQTVLGLTADRIAAAYVLPKAAMAQRLVRAKSKIRQARIPFRKPEPEELPERLPPVLDAIYAAFGQSWEEADTVMAQEALFLAELIVTLLPEEPEAQGLFALMCYVEARRPARRTARGAYVPLDDQNPKDWDRPLLLRAEGVLHRAARAARPGRYQTEAAIQSLHSQRAFGRASDPQMLVTAHRALLAQHPSLGAAVSCAGALLSAGHVSEAKAQLAAIDDDLAAQYQPYWAVLAEVQLTLGEPISAAAQAIRLAQDPAVQAHLTTRFGLTTP